MDGDDGDLVFDFEEDLDAAADAASYGSAASATATAPALPSSYDHGPAAVRPRHDQGRGSSPETMIHEMDGDVGDLVFDFEDDLDAAADAAAAGSGSVALGAASALPSSDDLGPAAVGHRHDQGLGSRCSRQTVCPYWLLGVCMMGDSCEFLHEYDLDRMPVCHYLHSYGYCRLPDCVFKHNTEHLEEYSMYNVGFCPYCPHCQYRHVKKPGSPPPAEEVVKKHQQMNSLNYGSSSGIYQPRENNSNQQEKPQVQHGLVLKNQNLAANATHVVQEPAAHHVQTANPQHVPPHIQQQQQHNAQLQGVPNGSSSSPLPQGQSRYSVVKSCKMENLEISVQQGIWASPKAVTMSF
ncbi:zinc finger CCCH domain-containing protein 45 [Lolium perenne]|uniref:zinc finger CCCH domain-containing protein 45 n=1 Tax=Lolium perenne TaxID=4522 RepID=UPI0021F558B2|nr:zinc finger CCCH domain-containing protein 45-like [Lolium perenne]XP_051206363.1 zinc finger CCCH domain-containing protein 45-like [Lolium perenne]XP_051206364.1 zinc finger CCCH domain-containing protein 45-like [Lolium perenne]XP_051206365.1 zinc finger CCCH domain-containing protein 45-like [Lolium perenne]XP_051206366.1 zinc finger CCCH domain-containing protein 45-like [Lolium perenne]XP_051206367.1 zinc finger CCCH domain-containing protein 45-like [Lolium perenne]XP_051206368.1 zi